MFFFAFFIDLTDLWCLIEGYVEAFEPLYDCTIAIQSLNCTLSDFFGHWMTAFGRVASIQSNMFQSGILDAMQRRETSLLNNYAMQAALYIAPGTLSVVQDYFRHSRRKTLL